MNGASVLEQKIARNNCNSVKTSRDFSVESEWGFAYNSQAGAVIVVLVDSRPPIWSLLEERGVEGIWSQDSVPGWVVREKYSMSTATGALDRDLTSCIWWTYMYHVLYAESRFNRINIKGTVPVQGYTKRMQFSPFPELQMPVITSVKGVMFLLRLVRVCVCHQHYAKSYWPIFTKILGRVQSGPRNNRLDFGGDPDHRLDTGCF